MPRVPVVVEPLRVSMCVCMCGGGGGGGDGGGGGGSGVVSWMTVNNYPSTAVLVTGCL